MLVRLVDNSDALFSFAFIVACRPALLLAFGIPMEKRAKEGQARPPPKKRIEARSIALKIQKIALISNKTTMTSVATMSTGSGMDKYYSSKIGELNSVSGDLAWFFGI